MEKWRVDMEPWASMTAGVAMIVMGIIVILLALDVIG